MIEVGVNLEIHPDLLSSLSSGKKLCRAVHDDGSENRIDGDAVLEAATYGISLGILTAFVMWIRKKFKNRGKTAEDFRAEKEAVRINNTCAALEEMLLEYLQSAQDGIIIEEALDELIDTAEEMHAYCQDGKLLILGKEDLCALQRSIAAYTDAIARSRSMPASREAETTEADVFCSIRDQLIRQKELIRRIAP